MKIDIGKDKTAKVRVGKGSEGEKIRNKYLIRASVKISMPIQTKANFPKRAPFSKDNRNRGIKSKEKNIVR